MENAGILSIAAELGHVPFLEELLVYQNTLKEEGLRELFKQLRTNCKNITSLDIQDNFVRGGATAELVQLLKESLSLRNLNLSDCLNEEQNEVVVSAFEVVLELGRNRKTGSGSG
jgi:Ran GTPase-activating protein (RanGAP) involved in mRNA processing and transport